MCSQQRIFSVHSRKRGLNRKPGPPVHDDLLERDFTAETVNSKWLTDPTEHPTGEGKLYLCAIKDCASNRIVGYSLDAWMTSELAVAALRNAIALRSPEGTIVHSGRESTPRPRCAGSRPRMGCCSRSGAPGCAGTVNAMAESFFATFKNELIYRRPWPTLARTKTAVVTWIEGRYNRRRRHSAIGMLTPDPVRDRSTTHCRQGSVTRVHPQG